MWHCQNLERNFLITAVTLSSWHLHVWQLRHCTVYWVPLQHAPPMKLYTVYCYNENHRLISWLIRWDDQLCHTLNFLSAGLCGLLLVTRWKVGHHWHVIISQEVKHLNLSHWNMCNDLICLCVVADGSKVHCVSIKSSENVNDRNRVIY